MPVLIASLKASRRIFSAVSSVMPDSGCTTFLGEQPVQDGVAGRPQNSTIGNTERGPMASATFGPAIRRRPEVHGPGAFGSRACEDFLSSNRACLSADSVLWKVRMAPEGFH